MNVRHSGGQNGMHAAAEGHVHLTPLETHGGLVQCGKGRCAGHVQGHRRSRQSQCEGHPPDSDTSGGAEIPDLPAVKRDQVPVLASTQSGIHPDTAAPQCAGIDPCVLEGLPGRLQQEPLARVHRPGLDGLDAEEACVEAVDPLDEGAVPVRASPGRRVGRHAVTADGVRAPFRHRAAPLREKLPESTEIRCARESARHADDCDAVHGSSWRRRGNRLGC